MARKFTTQVAFSNLTEELEAIIASFDPDRFKQVRWFQQKDSNIKNVTIADYSQFDLELNQALICPVILNFRLQDQVKNKEFSDQYYFPLLISKVSKQSVPWLIIEGVNYQAYVYDGTNDLNYVEAVEKFMQQKQEVASRQGGTFTGYWLAGSDLSAAYQLTDVSSNSITKIKKEEIIKTFRRLPAGVNPELEMSLSLQQETEFDWFPTIKGYVNYIDNTGQQHSIALVQEFIANEGDLWSYTQRHLQNLFAAVKQRSEQEQVIEQMSADYQALTATVGQIIGQLHLALAAIETESFTPRLPKQQEINSWAQEVKSNFRLLVEHLKPKQDDLDIDPPVIDTLLAWQGDIDKIGELILDIRDNLGKFMRCHGDLHLEQLLTTEDGIMVLDFEGEPTKNIAERRRKYSPLKDISGMLRSYNYAGYVGYFNYLGQAEKKDNLAEVRKQWEDKVVTTFQNHYLQTVRPKADFLPPADYFPQVIALFKLEKALYEALYEVNNRPDWLSIPLQGIIDCLHELN